MSKGMLIDVTRCTACRGCQVACKQWNDKPGESTRYSASRTNPPALSARTLCLLDLRPAERNGEEVKLSFVKLQCMHCIDPACVSACPVAALTKEDNGPVVYHAERCFGCRYCMVSCPFEVPKFEWWKAIPTIQKCQFCFDRIEQGLEPACATACPNDAVVFGERDALLFEAKSRIYRQTGKYVPHVYGEREVGGTAIMYISDVPFEKLGLPTNLGEKAYPENTKLFLLAVPLVLMAWPALFAGVNALVKLRERGLREAEQEAEEGLDGRKN